MKSFTSIVPNVKLLCNSVSPYCPNDKMNKVDGIASNKYYRVRNPFRRLKSCLNENIWTNNCDKNTNNNIIRGVI